MLIAQERLSLMDIAESLAMLPNCLGRSSQLNKCLTILRILLMVGQLLSQCQSLLGQC